MMRQPDPLAEEFESVKIKADKIFGVQHYAQTRGVWERFYYKRDVDSRAKGILLLDLAIECYLAGAFRLAEDVLLFPNNSTLESRIKKTRVDLAKFKGMLGHEIIPLDIDF